jgi:hypothetical protein
MAKIYLKKLFCRLLYRILIFNKSSGLYKDTDFFGVTEDKKLSGDG